MSLWDTASDWLSGGARSDVNNAYDDSQRYLKPYRKGGEEDYETFRRGVSDRSNYLDRFNNTGESIFNHINQSPNAYYDEIMGGYSESPEAKYLTDKANKASAFGASASGLLGSGAFQKGLQENASHIAENDRQRYFNNVNGLGDKQFQYLQNIQQQQERNRAMQQYLASIGYGAASGAGANEINRGNALSKIDQQSMEDVGGLLGSGLSYYTGGAGGGMGGSGGGGVPMYAQKAIYGGI